MNRTHLTRYSNALKETLGWKNLTARGRQSGHCRRLREVTPQRLVCALVESLGAHRVETVADILRTFNAQTGLNVQYKAFHNRLVKPAFPRFMRQVYRDILRKVEAKEDRYDRLEKAIIHNRLGVAFRRQGDLTESAAWFRRSLAEDRAAEQTRIVSHLELGKTYDLLGRRAEATRQYEQVLEYGDFAGSRVEARDLRRRRYKGD